MLHNPWAFSTVVLLAGAVYHGARAVYWHRRQRQIEARQAKYAPPGPSA